LIADDRAAGPPPDAATAELVSPETEARAFWRMRSRVVATLIRQTFSGARLRVTLIAALSGLLWTVLFWLFFDGFRFLRNTIPADLHDDTVRIVFGMFFVTMMVMLIFSSGIILYSSLFRARDVPFLFTIPARAERVFLHKFQEATLLSSWAFLLLGSPMLLAYGMVAEAPPYYYAILVPFLAAFTYIPAGIGAIICVLIVRYMPSRRVVVLGGLIAVGIVLSVWLGWSLTATLKRDLLTPSWFRGILDRLSFTEHRLLPSWWLSSGLLEAAQNEWSESVMFLVLMVSNALFFRQLAIWTAARSYRSAYSSLCGRRTFSRRIKLAWLDRWLIQAPPLLPKQVRLMVVKDLRLFRRDPVQWSQFLIFFALLALYFLNIRRFSYDVYYKGWVNMVSFLNVSVVGLLLSTFTTRFIFPMISLESRRFWILGLLPLKRDTILWSKFVFAVGGALIPSSLLILLSDVMLGVSGMIVASHQLTCLILCFGLSGIAVGLGARMPMLREESPSRIAAGFGGTLNLVFSTLYILVVVLLTALPLHFYLGTQSSAGSRLLAYRPELSDWLQFWLVAGTVVSLLLGLLATVVPLRIGFRTFRKMEF
jgi:ABC-2 type transport system permease protein